MCRFLARTAVLAVLLILPGIPAQAQYGGWGGWGGASTVQGSMARGAGVAAAGAGVYNVDTAQARSMNANTAMQVNQYMYEVNLNNAQHYYARSAAKQKQTDLTGKAMYSRIHDNPSSYDIHNGDALNVVLDELTNPQVYTQAVQGATQPIASQLVRNIAFEYAANMITTSLEDLTASGVPDVLLTTPDFQAERQAVKAQATKARTELENQGQVSPETLANCRVAIKALHDKVDAVLPQGTRTRAEADNYLKALYGLTKMLKSPSVDQFLVELKKLSTTTMGHLITFMHTFNLRFGAAKGPDQEAAYDQLYPLLVALRDRVNAPSSAPFATQDNTRDPKKVTGMFSGMDMKQLQSQGGPAPAPPAPGPQ